MKMPSDKAQGLIEDYIESAGSDRAVFEYIARLEDIADAAEAIARMAQSVPEWRESPNLKTLLSAFAGTSS